MTWGGGLFEIKHMSAAKSSVLSFVLTCEGSRRW